jgi:hypothetical protein
LIWFERFKVRMRRICNGSMAKRRGLVLIQTEGHAPRGREDPEISSRTILMATRHGCKWCCPCDSLYIRSNDRHRIREVSDLSKGPGSHLIEQSMKVLLQNIHFKLLLPAGLAIQFRPSSTSYNRYNIVKLRSISIIS